MAAAGPTMLCNPRLQAPCTSSRPFFVDMAVHLFTLCPFVGQADGSIARAHKRRRSGSGAARAMSLSLDTVLAIVGLVVAIVPIVGLVVGKLRQRRSHLSSASVTAGM